MSGASRRYRARFDESLNVFWSIEHLAADLDELERVFFAAAPDG
jgi:hypothetical protein